MPSSRSFSSRMRMPDSTRTSGGSSFRLGSINSSSSSSARVSPPGRRRNPGASATSDHECPEPTARTVVSASSASWTISWISSSDSGSYSRRGSIPWLPASLRQSRRRLKVRRRPFTRSPWPQLAELEDHPAHYHHHRRGAGNAVEESRHAERFDLPEVDREVQQV